jgi:hypothetical protein
MVLEGQTLLHLVERFITGTHAAPVALHAVTMLAPRYATLSAMGWPNTFGRGS